MRSPSFNLPCEDKAEPLEPADVKRVPRVHQVGEKGVVLVQRLQHGTTAAKELHFVLEDAVCRTHPDSPHVWDARIDTTHHDRLAANLPSRHPRTPDGVGENKLGWKAPKGLTLLTVGLPHMGSDELSILQSGGSIHQKAVALSASLPVHRTLTNAEGIQLSLTMSMVTRSLRDRIGMVFLPSLTFTTPNRLSGSPSVRPV